MDIQKLGVVAGLACLLAGCSGLRLYDAERDRQGQAARQAWSEVNLQETIDGERANLQKLLAAEVEAQQTLATAIRDHELRAMVRGASVAQALVERVDARLEKLAERPEALQGARQKLGQLRVSQELMRGKSNDLASKNLAVPACPELADGATPAAITRWLAQNTDPKAGAIVDSAVYVLRRECGRQPSEADIYQPVGGAIGTAWVEYAREEQQLHIEKAQLSVLEKSYRQAREEHEKAVAAARADPGLQAAAESAAGRVRKAVDALQASSSPFAARLLADERLQAIADLALAITEAQADQGAAASAAANKTSRAFAVLPRLADDAQAALAQAKKPLALPLLLRKNHEQLNLEAARRDIAAREDAVRLSRELVMVLYQQAQQLALAGEELKQAKDLHGRTVADAFSNGTTRQREALYGGAARYLDAIGRLDAKRYTLEYQRVGAHHERALAYAEVNAKQWESLIDTSVSQVADYSASGFKPGQIADFLNTLGLLSIGVGVNK